MRSLAALLLSAVLLAPTAGLRAVDTPKTEPAQLKGIELDKGAANISGQAALPKFIPDPSSTADYNRAKRTCSGVPSIAVSRGGRLWAMWYSGTTPGEIIERCANAYAVLSTSGDGGKSWKEVLAIDPDGAGPHKAFDPQPWVDPDGRLWVIWHQTGGKAWAVTTDDAEKEKPVWTRPRVITTGIMMNKPVVLSDGSWLFAVNRRKTGTVSQLEALLTRDHGRTFLTKGRLEVSYNLQPYEPMFIERKDGSLWLLTRTLQGIGESLSIDGGATWEPLKVSAIRHTASRFYIGRLKSGNLLLVKHLGIDEDPLSEGKARQRRELTAFLSKDEGRTWSAGLVIDDRNGVSYPDAQQAADGTVYLCWDFMRSRHQEILMTTFVEKDLLATNDEAAGRVKSNRRLISKGGTSE
jgi:hypothetical protein